MEKIKGLIDAPFTPFDRNGDVNCEPIPAYAAMLHKNGLKGVFINGSSGEGYMLTTEERMALEPTYSRNIIKLQIINNQALFGVHSKSKSF